jgi:hypothetical protein
MQLLHSSIIDCFRLPRQITRSPVTTSIINTTLVSDWLTDITLTAAGCCRWQWEQRMHANTRGIISSEA